MKDRQFSVRENIYLKADDEEEEQNGQLPCKKIREA